MIGGLIGAIAFLAACVAVMAFFALRRNKRKNKDTADLAAVEMQPTPPESGTNYAPVPASKPTSLEGATNYAPIATGSTPPDLSNGTLNQSNGSVGSRSAVSTISPKNIDANMIKSEDWEIQYSEIKMVRQLGSGAFGEVYEGKWRGIRVAVKKLIGSQKDIAVSEFFAEAELMKKMRPHPNVTMLLGVVTSPICLVTEYVPNGDLWDFLQKGQVANELKLRIAQGIAAGMFHLHQLGVIHRDLAARNILLDSNFNPKVSDFGMSRVAIQESGNKTSTEIGPIRWMAPEALGEKVYNIKTDVWSFGVTLYEIMTQKMPYEKTDIIHVATSVALGKVSLVPEIQKNAKLYPLVLVEVFQLCLQVDPEKRPDFPAIVHMLDV